MFQIKEGVFMTDEPKERGEPVPPSPAEEETRLLAEERRSWLIWTFGIAGAIAVVIIIGSIAISPGPDQATTGSTRPPPQVEAPAP